MTHVRLGLAAAAAALLAVASPALAAPFSAEVVFGDSLSDNGNLADALGHNFPTPPFFNNSFTNGPVAVQVLAQRLGLQATASYFPTAGVSVSNPGVAPGTNFAVAGATAGTSIPTGTSASQGVTGLNLGAQIGAFLTGAGGTAPASALYTVFIGGNDVRTAAHQGSAAYVTDGITAELQGIATLIARGAKNLLVVNVPDVGLIPEFTTYSPAGQAAAATAYSQSYNAQLAAGVAALVSANPTDNIKLFDLYGFNNNIVANPGSLGITNNTQACYISYGGVTNNNPLVINPACGAIDPATNQAANIGTFQDLGPHPPDGAGAGRLRQRAVRLRGAGACGPRCARRGAARPGRGPAPRRVTPTGRVPRRTLPPPACRPISRPCTARAQAASSAS